jgi:hypothetical protein
MTVGRIPLVEGSIGPSQTLYFTIHDTHNRQKSMPLAGFEPAIPSSEWQQNLALG